MDMLNYLLSGLHSAGQDVHDLTRLMDHQIYFGRKQIALATS